MTYLGYGLAAWIFIAAWMANHRRLKVAVARASADRKIAGSLKLISGAISMGAVWETDATVLSEIADELTSRGSSNP